MGLEDGVDLAQRIRLNPRKFSVDMVFGPEDDNDVVYNNTIQPLLTTAKKVDSRPYRMFKKIK